jgi:hypothetical protein
MPAASRVWTWLGKPRNRSVLALLGAGLAAIVAAAWQVYLHVTPPAAPPPPSVVIQMQAPQAQATLPSAPSPDVSAVKNLQASETRNLNDDANALGHIAEQIEASNPPPRPAARGR